MVAGVWAKPLNRINSTVFVLECSLFQLNAYDSKIYKSTHANLLGRFFVIDIMFVLLNKVHE